MPMPGPSGNSIAPSTNSIPRRDQVVYCSNAADLPVLSPRQASRPERRTRGCHSSRRGGQLQIGKVSDAGFHGTVDVADDAA